MRVAMNDLERSIVHDLQQPLGRLLSKSRVLS